MKYVRFLAKLLIIVGALNWGLIGFFQYNLVAALFGGDATTMARVIYSLVGLAGLYSILFLCKSCCCCCGCSKCSCSKKDNDQQ
jgi:uncharacterized protein